MEIVKKPIPFLKINEIHLGGASCSRLSDLHRIDSQDLGESV